MDSGLFLTEFFTQIWRIFSVESPVFGLKYSEIFIGFFLIGLMIKLLRFLFVPDMSGTKDKGSGLHDSDS